MEHIATDDWDGYSPWRAIDRYRPCFELASGGMGTVFLARVSAPATLHRFVALKRIHPHLVKEPGFLEMFLDEAHVASRIVHPNVCSVFDFDAEGGHPYIAMEYLMGEPLTRVGHAVSRLESPAEVERVCRRAARVVADACEGLHAAHELRDGEGKLLHVVHRDVSPQNLFLTYDGAVKVVDFGLVRMADCLHKTRTGIVKGKFGYLAPEGLMMKPVDRRADVWGLGVVLWELVTGRRLFQRATEVDTVMAVAQMEIPAPSTVRPGVPPDLDAIILHALERQAEERYPTARDFGRDLVSFIHAGPEPIGLADLAEWTEQLFPRGRERKLELLEIAGQRLSEPRSRPPASARHALRPPAPIFEDPETPTHAHSSERPLPATVRSGAHPPAPTAAEAAEPEAPALSASTLPLSCSEPPRTPGRRPWWSAMSAAMAAFGLGVLITTGMSGFAARWRAPEAGPPSGGAEAWRPVLSSVLPERAVAVQRVAFSSPAPAEASGGVCTPDRDTLVLELVPDGDTEPRRIRVRTVQAARGP